MSRAKTKAVTMKKSHLRQKKATNKPKNGQVSQLAKMWQQKLREIRR